MQTTFKDLWGRSWRVPELDEAAFDRVRDRAAVDLGEIRAGKNPLPKLDVPRLAKVLIAILEPEAAARGVATDDLARAIADEGVFVNAARALFERMGALVPSGRRREYRRLLEQ